jgi:hypothetical protein
MNDFLMYTYEFKDEEIVDHYISLLKSISLRLAENPLSLFYNEVIVFYNVTLSSEIHKFSTAFSSD